MSKPSLTNELMRLAELRDKGVLTDEEFFVQKDKLLRGQEKQEPAPIYINQNQQQQQQQQQKQGGCLGSILKAIGAFVVLMVILATCVNDDEEKRPASSKESVLYQMAKSDDEYTEALLVETKRQNDLAIKEIGQVWEGLGPEIRAELKSEQVAWNRAKTSSCKNYSESNSNSNLEHDILNLQCEIQAMRDRIPELVEAGELASSIVMQKKIDKATSEGVKLKNNVNSTWSELSSDVKPLIEPIESWKNDTTVKCANGGGSQEADLKRLNCENQEFSKKVKELNGYKI